MFDIGWSEMLVLAVVTILVVGPRDLPRMLRTVGQAVGKVRRMAGEFQRQFNDALKEAELDDIKKGIDSARNAIPTNPVKAGLKSLASAGDDVKSAIEKPAAAAAATAASAASQDAGMAVAGVSEPEQDKAAGTAADAGKPGEAQNA